MIMIVIRIIAGILLLAAVITGVVSCYRWERSNDTGLYVPGCPAAV